MAVQRPSDGARLGLGDPLCKVKSTEEMLSPDGHEHYVTEAGQWYERRREQVEVSHARDRHPSLCQQDEYLDETKPGGRRW